MTLAQDITRHFKGEWHGSYGSLPAPGHSADDRGVTVKDTDGGRDVVFHSFNNADWRELKDECRRVGLLPERERANDNVSAPRETGHYEYADADGAVLYRTVRIEQAGKRKRFQAQRPNGRGGWINGMGDARRVIYRLPEIIATKADQPVYLVEGERKADKLASWGFTATAVAFGAKGWRRDYADALEGRTVIILPDNDDEGRGFADRAAKDLAGAGCTAHVLNLPGLPPKGDIIDWRGTADDLRALVEQQLNPPAVTFPLADLALWDTIPATPKGFIMPGFIPADEVTLATGAGGGNKSTFGQQLATCCAAGVPMLGQEVRQCATLYITAEDDDDRLHWMQQHICRALGVRMADLTGKLHLASLRGRLGNALATFDAEGRLRPAPAFNVLRATIEAAGAKLIVLDNAAHLFAGNENDRQQVTAFVNLLYSLCRDLGASIILVAHTNKAGDTYSGSTAWLNAVRSQIVLQRPEGSIDPDERVLTLGKANYARQGQEIRFRWHDFALVRDDDLPADTRAEIAATIQANYDNDLFLNCLDVRNGQERAVSENGASAKTYAPKVFADMPESKGVGIKRLEAAMDRLFRIGEIERGFLWREDRKDKFGLRRACADPAQSAPTPRADPAPTRCADPAPTPRQPRAHTHPIYKYIPGAAHGAAAPSQEKNGAAIARPIFPAPHDDDGLDADGNVIGWSDRP
ncbi:MULTISPECIES: AAA family ATPase [unclassified Sphingobium]|uniref:AAA family ATPase n=1 Tax=unclassified Sphingobium TaxID=2611147 RepID=UPI0035A6CBD0